MTGLGIVKKPVEELTVKKLKELFPAKKATITDETVEIINQVQQNPEFDGHKMINNMVSLQSVMTKNSSSMTEFIEAVTFCAFLEADDKYIDAYKKTFAHRDFVSSRLNAPTISKEYKELSSAASRYRKSPIIIDILTQANVPLYLMFQGTTFEAVGVLSKEMTQAPHAKDRIAAAKAILEHVKPPENVKVELDIGVVQNDAVQDLNDQLAKFASSTAIHLKAGSADLKSLGAMKPKGEFDDENIIDIEDDEEFEKVLFEQAVKEERKEERKEADALQKTPYKRKKAWEK